MEHERTVNRFSALGILTGFQTTSVGGDALNSDFFDQACLNFATLKIVRVKVAIQTRKVRFISYLAIIF